MADITIVGNITRDPELRFTQSGLAVATFGLAENRRWQNRTTSEWEEHTSFYDVTVWGDMAENVATSLAKGARVVVVGRIEQQSWENEAGEKRSKHAVIASDIGPSLRWATAEVAKVERSDRAPATAGAPPAGAYQYGADEEPF